MICVSDDERLRYHSFSESFSSYPDRVQLVSSKRARSEIYDRILVIEAFNLAYPVSSFEYQPSQLYY